MKNSTTLLTNLKSFLIRCGAYAAHGSGKRLDSIFVGLIGGLGIAALCWKLGWELKLQGIVSSYWFNPFTSVAFAIFGMLAICLIRFTYALFHIGFESSGGALAYLHAQLLSRLWLVIVWPLIILIMYSILLWLMLGPTVRGVLSAEQTASQVNQIEADIAALRNMSAPTKANISKLFEIAKITREAIMLPGVERDYDTLTDLKVGLVRNYNQTCGLTLNNEKTSPDPIISNFAGSEPGDVFDQIYSIGSRYIGNGWISKETIDPDEIVGEEDQVKVQQNRSLYHRTFLECQAGEKDVGKLVTNLQQRIGRLTQDIEQFADDETELQPVP